MTTKTQGEKEILIQFWIGTIAAYHSLTLSLHLLSSLCYSRSNKVKNRNRKKTANTKPTGMVPSTELIINQSVINPEGKSKGC